MQKTQDIKIEDFDYPLPDERIAKYPLERRDTSKLLVYRSGEIAEHRFSDISQLLPARTLLVFNNTRVIQARIHFRKETGALIEVFCLEPCRPHDYALSFQAVEHCSWLCMIGNLKKWKEGALSRTLTVNGRQVTLKAERVAACGTSHEVRFSWDDAGMSFASVLDAVGELPIPPYLNRETEERDKETYQTVYSKVEGSVAAPTAGLHFTPEVLAALDANGIRRRELTLHVGAGTFKPVKSETMEGHTMHTEFISVEKQLIAELAENLDCVVAVGTTSVRTLESLYYVGLILSENPEATGRQLEVEQWMPYGSTLREIPVKEALLQIVAYLEKNGMSRLVTATRIIIAPGYRFKIVRGMVTNFHQPKSTLLLLVSAFVDGDWRRIYDYALSHGFRFLSYGDSSLLLKEMF
ncbi:MAG TPA: S-adenosylmethionine:tRNA ribosyltransferase-isomerase [Candidatus Gallibacteroides avistercoris]|uniref:S-adenosylmethionine:tRNA ribosyltransferase-isomerase n=1 Tax=Candidatus Gallibacteroides avistercoris TaxID=2840833 RepID=A0A9D1SCQ8_9BACT|nr:S-adenosylmethionine:tRNA ribosyltransferase-isomerase [Candidatus Gallibacteroides avistercoris]